MRPAFRGYKRRPPASRHEALERLVRDAGGVKRAALLLGLARSQTYALTDPASGQELGLDRVEALTAASRSIAVAEYLAFLAGAVVVVLPPANASPEWAELGARITEGHALFSAELYRDLANDGAIDAAEAARLLPEIEDVLRVAGAIAERLRELIEGETET